MSHVEIYGASAIGVVQDVVERLDHEAGARVCHDLAPVAQPPRAAARKQCQTQKGSQTPFQDRLSLQEGRLKTCSNSCHEKQHARHPCAWAYRGFSNLVHGTQSLQGLLQVHDEDNYKHVCMGCWVF